MDVCMQSSGECEDTNYWIWYLFLMMKDVIFSLDNIVTYTGFRHQNAYISTILKYKYRSPPRGFTKIV